MSVGIPAYNRPELLRQALAGLAAQEEFDDFEVIVCDDLGLPQTRREVESCPLPRLRYYVNDGPPGAVANWNRCLHLAAGRWVTVLHEDDMLYPWYFATAVPHLRPGIAALAVKCAQAATPPDLRRSRSPRAPRSYEPAWFLKSAMTPFPGVLFPRDVGIRLNGFDERMGPLADYDFWYRLACSGPVEVLPEIAAFYRVNGETWTAAVWPEMLRRSHLLRLRIAREQLPHQPRLGRWLARFFTYRNALAYARRFPDRPAGLARTLRLGSIPLRRLPSGWVWWLLQHRHDTRNRPPTPASC